MGNQQSNKSLTMQRTVKAIASLLVASTYALELSLEDSHDARCLERAQRKFDRLDANEDDVLSLEEFLARMVENKTNKFNRADADNNGTLTFDEWKNTKGRRMGKKRMQSQMKKEKSNFRKNSTKLLM